MAAQSTPPGDICWLCSKPLDPSAEPAERVCPHCSALNKPRDPSPRDDRGVCANCGEVNRPQAARPATQPLDTEALERLELRHRKLYGLTLGLVPGITGALISLPALPYSSSRGGDDWLIGAIAGFIYMAVASLCALLWKLARTPAGRSDLAGGAASGFGVSVVATTAVVGLVIALKSVLR